ncbi:hypothetical protein RFI_27398 [Reticulomyxa filosa]|uniref:SANT domain-containing protein n=1 Tax=Reticulomyxa filosa TaxID=46433 RepID=X6M7L9_RETFI|nr:hypothetical protein RFI_27398 [Reticulomyxa filosa]|eukprot:ETO09978.1 hypothetical protein RFI_27398 [Reticulomyxa filosa]
MTGNEARDNVATFEYSTLDVLLSPYRKRSPIDEWSAREVALFESAMCCKGKNFYEISKIIGTKCCKQVIEFYYFWKNSTHYQTWKQIQANREAHENNCRKLHYQLGYAFKQVFNHDFSSAAHHDFQLLSRAQGGGGGGGAVFDPAFVTSFAPPNTQSCTNTQSERNYSLT